MSAVKHSPAATAKQNLLAVTIDSPTYEIVNLPHRNFTCAAVKGRLSDITIKFFKMLIDDA